MTQFTFPKADLHLHLDGSLSLDFFRKFSREQGLTMTDEELLNAVTVKDSCRSLEEYLKCFALSSQLLHTADALTFAAFDLIRRLEAQGLYYAELRFAPQLHAAKGLTQQQTVEAVLKGVALAKEQHYRIQIGILLCMFVTGSRAANQETAELAVAYKNRGIHGLDIAGPEGAVPMSSFAPLFSIAYHANVPLTIHAGECGDYENITRAVSYGARRIGHGCAAILSDSCMKLLAREKITLEMCPTSNLHTKAVSSPEKHPIRTFFDRGIRVTVNTDNMTCSNTTLDKEYQLLVDHLGFTQAELQVLSRNALEAAFAPIVLPE